MDPNLYSSDSESRVRRVDGIGLYGRVESQRYLFKMYKHFSKVFTVRYGKSYITDMKYYYIRDGLFNNRLGETSHYEKGTSLFSISGVTTLPYEKNSLL